MAANGEKRAGLDTTKGAHIRQNTQQKNLIKTDRKRGKNSKREKGDPGFGERVDLVEKKKFKKNKEQQTANLSGQKKKKGGWGKTRGG